MAEELPCYWEVSRRDYNHLEYFSRAIDNQEFRQEGNIKKELEDQHFLIVLMMIYMIIYPEALLEGV